MDKKKSPLGVYEILVTATLPEDRNPLSVFCVVLVVQALVVCVVVVNHCLSVAMVLSVLLRFTASDYPFWYLQALF
jgi:hypothetical protein